MIKIIFWDLDGVLRMLGSHVLGWEPNTWDEKKDGKTVIDYINEHPELCLYSPCSEYLPIVNSRKIHLNILTNQLPSWITWTEQWLDKNIKTSYEVTYTKGPEQKLSMLGKSDIIVEDYPKFSDYSKVALVTRNYNKHLEVPLRISTIDEMEAFLDKYY